MTTALRLSYKWCFFERTFHGIIRHQCVLVSRHVCSRLSARKVNDWCRMVTAALRTACWWCTRISLVNQSLCTNPAVTWDFHEQNSIRPQNPRSGFEPENIDFTPYALGRVETSVPLVDVAPSNWLSRGAVSHSQFRRFESRVRQLQNAIEDVRMV